RMQPFLSLMGYRMHYSLKTQLLGQQQHYSPYCILLIITHNIYIYIYIYIFELKIKFMHEKT
ncbi:MAG: hypothetical protein MCS20_01095, partial [Candidatus Phytoplasma mali]|nr:hypothetical protein [Candidatus Phytoplasma australiense]MCG7201995.1 hypothetical protein [Candidatus Phytoplasma mali]MCZ8632008.1 hypothetical protein [Spiroplasma sp. Tabriz.8]